MDAPRPQPLPETLQQVEHLFAEALSTPPQHRAAFLHQACADNPALRDELESLLACYLEADDFLEAIDTEQALALLKAGGGPPIDEGDRIGPYQVKAQIGRGGMGAVYLAERADGHFEQHVALKLIKRGMDSEAILRRFLTERQILARLAHPHIARLYDGGVTEAGQPYFAMEYIEGVPITVYCDRQRLDVEARLGLFMEACQAVQFAHANLVVHRDLKPSNMLVTGEGRLKLLDFGIAKVLDDQDSAEAPVLEEEGLRAMTPEYAAPEQVQGEPITTATDVYALGIILYELLTGHRPFSFERQPTASVMQVICAQEPDPPSMIIRQVETVVHADGTTETVTPQLISRARSTQPDRLRRQLTGDLDAIVLAALQKEPTQRYVSAEGFLEDIKRHLAGFPVSVHMDTFRYRTSKFIGRHRMGVGATVLVVLSLALGLLSTAWQAQEKAHEAARAEEVKNFVLGLFALSDPDQIKGETITARKLLDEGVVRIETELADQPETQAELLSVVGGVYEKLGLFDEAREVLDQALTLHRSLFGSEHLAVAASLNRLGQVFFLQGHYPEADSLYHEALAIRRAHLGTSHLDVATVLGNLAQVRWRQGAYEAADSLHRRVLALRRDLLGASHPEVASSLAYLGIVARAQGDYDAAETRHREALAIRQAYYGEEHHLVAESLKNLALVLHSQSRYDEAETLYRQALQVQTQLYGATHPEIARTLNSLASLLRMKGDFDTSEPLFRQALAMRRNLLGPTHPDVATTLTNLADLLTLRSKPEAALALYKESLAIRRERFGSDHPGVATTLNNTAVLLREQERFSETLPLFEEVLAIYRARLGSDHPWVAVALLNLGRAQHGLNAIALADSLFEQAWAIQQAALPEGHTDFALTLREKGEVALSQGRLKEAEVLLLQTLDIWQAALPDGHWRLADTESALGACLSAQRRVAEAEPLLVAGYDRLKEVRGEQTFITRRARRRLVAHYERRGQPDRAAALVREGEE